MKFDNPESGLFSVFRLFVGIRLVYFFLSLLVPILAPFPILVQLPFSEYFGIAESTFLLIYLSWPRLHKYLGKWYLPIALGIVTIAPFIENFLNADLNHVNEYMQISLLNNQWQLFIFLLVPLIMVSWQYSFRIVITYCLSLVILDVASITVVQSISGGFILRPISLFMFRTLVFIFVGYIIGRLVTEQRQQNTRLNQANRQLASYTNTLEQLTISRERNRMAREFHDTLAHTLSAVAVQLEAVNALWDNDPGKSRAMLAQSLTETRLGLTETRRSIQALRASPLEDLGLTLAVQNLAQSITDRNNLILDMHIPDEVPGLTPESEHVLYRILEEALRNIVQHARAKTVSIQVRRQDHHIVMTVQDDGEGFDPEQVTTDNHFGLRGMREYADSVQASLTIDSHPNQGTLITVQLEAKDGESFDL
jgi:signal transduction histidine kinase